VELRRLGTSGLRVSALSLGAMTFGASQTNLKGVTSSEEEARRVFDRALEAGINLVDTANVYTEGRSEELTGEWVAGKRDQLLIATKCRFPIGFGMTRKPGPHEWGLSRKAVMAACEGSLRRLKTDVIDLYQVHMQDRYVAIDETLRALDDLVTEGKVRYIGCANYAGYSLVESLWAADRLQSHRYESIQLQWSLVQRSAERELIPAAAAFGLGVLVWAPLSRGFCPENTNAAERRRRDLASTQIRIISGPWTTRRTGIYSTWSAELLNSIKPLIPLCRSLGFLRAHKRPPSS
jgi:aryl-alcohol dehydrogenase-like predicted oxidoreductase